MAQTGRLASGTDSISERRPPIWTAAGALLRPHTGRRPGWDQPSASSLRTRLADT
jgi:hypothetical protein